MPATDVSTRRHAPRLLHGLLGLAVALLATALPVLAFDPEASLVEIEVSKKTFDETIPWIRRSAQVKKNGAVLTDRRILTTADGLEGQYLCRIRQRGEPRPFKAAVEWIDFYANVAVLSVETPAFWHDLVPVPLASQTPQTGNLDLFRWRSGRIEKRDAEIIRLSVGQSHTSHLQHLALALSSDIDAAGRAEVAVMDEALVGLIDSAGKKQLTVLPAAIIDGVLSRRAATDGAALGHFNFDWMPATNPALVRSKGHSGNDRGIVVTKVEGRGEGESESTQLKRGDLILSINGFEIDSEGKFLDPDYGRLSFQALATRRHAAGETIPMRIWRDGEASDLEYRIRAPNFSQTMIPAQRYRRPPDYLVAGGLVFQPLTGPLLRALGDKKPLLLDYYNATQPLEDRSGLILVGQVLPDDFNRGYEQIRYAAVDTINGRTIETLEDVARAFAGADSEYHRVAFMPTENIAHIVLDASTMAEADARIRRNYNLPQ